MKIPGFELVTLPPGGVEIRSSIKEKVPRGGKKRKKKKKKRTGHHT